MQKRASVNDLFLYKKNKFIPNYKMFQAYKKLMHFQNRNSPTGNKKIYLGHNDYSPNISISSNYLVWFEMTHKNNPNPFVNISSFVQAAAPRQLLISKMHKCIRQNLSIFKHNNQN